MRRWRQFSSDEVIQYTNDTNNQVLEEHARIYQERILKCEFTHKGLDRYYYIQLAHPEAEGQSSVFLIFMVMVAMLLEQMNYTNFNDLANTKENNFILIHPQGAPLNTVLTSAVLIGIQGLGLLVVL